MEEITKQTTTRKPQKKSYSAVGLMVSMFIVVVISATSGIVAGTLVSQKGTRVADSLIPIETPSDGEKDSIQLKPLKFRRIVNTTSDCNSGTLKGTYEPWILWAVSPDPGTSVPKDGKIKIWYNDEYPLTLGSGAVSDPSTKHVINPNVGDESARDINNFPYFPALFLTDITNNPNDKSGDVQNNGIPHKPSEIWGNWQALNSEQNFKGNNLILPPGADPFPAVSNITFNNSGIFNRGRESAHGAEIIWNVSDLNLTPQRVYRAQFIIHDGDRDGDIGEGCVTIQS